MAKVMIIAMAALVVGLFVAMALRAQRRGRPQPLDGLGDEVYRQLPNAGRNGRGFDVGPPA
jgi:hypothetical protein